MQNPYKNDTNTNFDLITNYLDNMKNDKEDIKNRTIIELERVKRNDLVLNEKKVLNKIDTNIKNYTVDDIFDLLNIDINENSDYERLC